MKEVAPAVTSLERELIVKEEPKKGKITNKLLNNTCCDIYIYVYNCFDYYLVRELSDAEKMMIVHSEDFQQFMDRAGRVMERALSENVDIYTDYTGALDDNDIKLVQTKLKIIKLVIFLYFIF